MEALIVASILVVLGLVYYLFFSPQAQVFGRFSYRRVTHEKIIALTFDDGPNPIFTQKILDALGARHVPATFFIVGKNLERHPEIGRAMVSAGHVIANHGYSHSFLKYLIDFTFRTEIMRTQAVIKQITGKSPALFRPPWLFRHPWIFRTLKKNNLTPVSGIFGSYVEIFQPQAKNLAARVMKKIKPGMILIFHDGYNAQVGNRAQTAEAINLLLPQLLDLGYQFVTVDRLLGVPAYQKPDLIAR